MPSANFQVGEEVSSAVTEKTKLTKVAVFVAVDDPHANRLGKRLANLNITRRKWRLLVEWGQPEEDVPVPSNREYVDGLPLHILASLVDQHHFVAVAHWRNLRQNRKSEENAAEHRCHNEHPDSD